MTADPRAQGRQQALDDDARRRRLLLVGRYILAVDRLVARDLCGWASPPDLRRALDARACCDPTLGPEAIRAAVMADVARCRRLLADRSAAELDRFADDDEEE